jgi:DegV family protein with EDD domain
VEFSIYKEVEMGKATIAIVTDSSAYIPEEALGGFKHLHIIPLWLIWDGESLGDGVDIDPPTFYDRLTKSKTIPSSSQPTAGEFVDVFKKAAEDAEAVLAILVSSKISGTVDSATQAQAMLPDIPIRVVDTFNVSMGLGFPVIEAAKAVMAGKSLDEAAAAAEEIKDKVHFLFVVDTLEYLHKGGRIGGAKRLMGTALQIKPILHFWDGAIDSLSQTRTQKKALQEMLDIAEERLGGKKMAAASVIHANVPDEAAKVVEMVKARFGIGEVLLAPVSPVVGTHAGPGAIGLVFYADDKN